MRRKRQENKKAGERMGEKQGLCAKALIRSIKGCVFARESERECVMCYLPGEYKVPFSPINEHGAKGESHVLLNSRLQLRKF